MAAVRPGFLRLCAATLFHFIALGMFLAALPLFVTQELGGSRADVGLAVGSFSISAVIMRPYVGRTADRRGRRLFMIGAPSFVIVTCAGLALVGAVWQVVALRVLQGVAGAGFYTSAATVATDLAPENRRVEFISRFSLFLYAGFATGPSIAEWVIRQGGFGWAWAAAAASALCAAVLSATLPETLPPRADGDDARPPRRILHPAAIGPGLVVLCAAVGYTAVTSFSPLYARHIGMSSSGLLYAVFALTIIAVRLFGGRLADRYGRVTVSLPGLVMASAGMAMLAAIQEPVPALVGIAAYGAGFAILFPALLALAADRAPESQRAEALGSYMAFFDVGASGGSYMVGAIADRAGFRAGFATPSVLCLVGFAVLLRLGRKVRAESEQAADESAWPEPAGA